MKTLIIVDVQNDFSPAGSLPVPDGDLVVPVINRIMDKFDLIVAALDWHPLEHASFAVNQGKEPGEVIKLDGIDQIMWPVHCVQNTKGADFIAGLVVSKINKVFQKGINQAIDSYSAFFDNQHKNSTGLAQYLKDKEVEEVFLTGLATDYCVKFSALDALELGFKTNLIIDACRGVNLNEGDVDQALEEMKTKGVKIIKSSEF